jgi:hypothetical protein
VELVAVSCVEGDAGVVPVSAGDDVDGLRAVMVDDFLDGKASAGAEDEGYE